ncbi:MAG: hypothetical protein GX444_10800 [Myxococcales bacterium]|nr:hypothetical protein [Myxococcales bacterium]
MKGIQCGNCGAPLKLTPADVEKGFATCGYCGSAVDLGLAAPVLDENTKRGLRLLSFAQKAVGAETADWNEPAARPADSRIELTNEPGIRFEANIPPRFRLGNVFLLVFTLFWCGFMLFWNGIALVGGQWIMLGFGVIHDAVAVWLFSLTTWNFLGHETIRAEMGWFVRRKRVLFFTTEKKFAWNKVEDFRIEVASRTNNNANYGLYAMVASKRRRLASQAAGDELRWLRTELKSFFEPIIQGQF